MIKTMILEAISKTTKLKVKIPNPNPNPSSPFIFKATYHKNMNKDYIRSILEKNLPIKREKYELNFKRLIIAFKRQPNLKEILFPSKLLLPLSINIYLLCTIPRRRFLTATTSPLTVTNDI